MEPDAPRIAGSMSAMRMPPDGDSHRGMPAGDAGGADGAAVGSSAGEMPGPRDPTAAPLPRFGGRLAGLGPLGARPAGEMPGGDMNGGLAALLAGVESGHDALDEAPPDGAPMPTGAMDDAGREDATRAMHATMNEGRAEMPTGGMSNGAAGAMPAAGPLRRHEDPDAGGELRRHENPDAGGELGAAPPDASAGGMPAADMHRTAASTPAAALDALGGAAGTLVIGGEWRLTLSSISLGRGG